MDSGSVGIHPERRVMMKRLCILFLSFNMAIAPYVIAGDAGQSEQQKLQGTWRILAGNEGGRTLPPARVKGSKMVVAGNLMTVYEAEKKRGMTFKLDPTKDPRIVDLKLTEGPQKGETAQGIYALDGDTLKISFALPGKSRPTSFTPKPGSQEMLFVMKREQP
jgi:uncharacterized protein (TIGR03067 family)